MKFGIESINFYTPHYYLDLEALAQERGLDPQKYLRGLGQEKMAVPPPDEDVVTMGANAAYRALENIERSSIDTIMFATESSIDQSKAAAIYVHKLLGLPTTCKAFEIKQACCSSTTGLQIAQALVTQNPTQKILLVASDIARYGFNTAGEPSQGAGAIAIVLSAQPCLLAFNGESGSYTEDVMDFWRPNYRDEALVDGKYSIKIYLKALAESWKHYVKESGARFEDFYRFCYHLPFTRMAEKAHTHLAKINKSTLTPTEQYQQVADSLKFNPITGNCYTASLYEGILSLMIESKEDLSEKRVGLFSYGSGCMATFFSGTFLPHYKRWLQGEAHHHMFATRKSLIYREYENFYTHKLPSDGEDYVTAKHETGLFRIAGIKEHKRIYETCPIAPPQRPPLQQTKSITKWP
ncbi:MAG: hydroxymethylglutaryl-CoA synthase [Kiritimatiellae bacterium]|nr:hydroxymethylglutaryl-CoA synthase [Kiritimatiellia bacterium]